MKTIKDYKELIAFFSEGLGFPVKSIEYWVVEHELRIKFKK